MKKVITGLAIASLLVASASFADEASLKSQIDSQAEQLQQLQKQTQSIIDQQSKASPSSSNSSDTTIGGYGEIGYNHYSGGDSGRTQMDLKRFVLFVAHRFNDKLSFSSEVEWEHAVTSNTDKGESEIEQAFLNYQIKANLNLRAGLFLMPFGFLNESHEPPVFYGVERNEVETRIIPSTWREGGVSLLGSSDIGLDWNIGLVTGFDMAKFDDAGYPLSSVHQELQLAKAHDLAVYGSLNYKIPGYIIGSALYSGNSMQGNADYNADTTQPNFAGVNGRITLGDVHTRWQQHKWDLQALFAKGSIGDAQSIDQTLDTYNTAQSSSRVYIPSEFYGWLAQAAYQIPLHGDASIEPFVRYEGYNTQAKMPSGFAKSSANEDHVATVGFSYKPIQQIVFKADYQNFRINPHSNRFNLGLGYMF